ncbi:glycosyl hydrolase [Spirochaetia bacterium]|nr:glycosyl hydrolase [Spirochaetia bacterium]
MGGKLNIILGSHHHIPWGAGDDEFEDRYRREIKPLCTALYKFPAVSMTFHFSGVMLQWIERNHAEFFILLRDLVSRKQVELSGGGFYEPLFPLLPPADKIGQIELFTTYLRKQFGKRPQGCWLPALVWEQSLASTLSACGMTYTFLSERAFAAAGGEDTAGLYYEPAITEDQGKIITVFPLAHRVEAMLERDGFPPVFMSLAEKLCNGKKDHTIALSLKKISHDEKEPPEVYYHRIFGELDAVGDSIEFVTPNKIFRSLRDAPKLYFPSSSGSGTAYHHLPRSVLISYPEVNGIYSKMMFVHLLINQLRGDKARKRNAREELWKAQGKDVFADKLALCRHPLRKAAYRALLEAEKISRGKGDFNAALSRFDFDFDGREEYLFKGDPLNCYVRSEGATVFELDYLPRSWNYLDTYGARSAFVDYLLPPAFSAKENRPEETAGARFCGRERYTALDNKDKDVLSFVLPSPGEGPFGQIEIAKTYRLKKDTLTLHYELCNRGKTNEALIFAPQFDLSFGGPGEAFLHIPIDGEYFESAGTLEMQDLKNEVLVVFSSDHAFSGKITPVYTGENGAEAYQSTCFLPLFPVQLLPGESWKGELKLRFSASRKRLAIPN